MLYFANSIGAAAGVLASGFALIAWAGLPGTLRTAGALNLLIAIVVAALARPARHASLEKTIPAEESGAARLLLAVAFFTGLASFVYEICWIRLMEALMAGIARTPTGYLFFNDPEGCRATFARYSAP